MVDFAEKLRNEILKGLPGSEVQWQMASSDRLIKGFPKSPGKDARIAAVLILCYPFKGQIHTVFMQRHDYDGVHGGQISFPGGKQEPSDKDIIQTAFREAKEETGVDPSRINVLGKLTPLFIPVSNMIVTPVVGWIEEKPVFRHKEDVVVFLFDADLKTLLDPSIIKIRPCDIRGEMIDVKYYDYNGLTIWGATAMILNELIFILKRGSFLLPK